MNINNLISYSALALAGALLAACDGGGSSSTGAIDTTTTVARSGTVTAFGSVFVNGIEYETDGASISVDGHSASESDLRVGMVVYVEGDDDGSTGHASSISNSDELEGLVISNSVDATTQTGGMNIMGQTVNISTATIFESYVSGVTRASEIAVGNIVEVNGYSDASGNIFATRLEVKAADLSSYLSDHSEGIEVKGVVGPIDAMDMTFPLGGITVNYAAAMIDISDGLQEGQYVEVKSTQGLNAGGQLVASKIDLESSGKMGHHGDEDDEFEIKGMVTADYADSMFMVDGTTVLVTADTELEHVTTAQLVAGTLVEVEGHFNADGNLVAEAIKREDDGDRDKVYGFIQSIVVSGTNSGTITLENGTVIVVTSSTLMVDDSVMHEQRFNLTYLAVGDYIEVYGYLQGSERIAQKLERDDASS